MDEASSPYEQMIQECEAAIVRMRTAIRAGTADSPAVGADWERIRVGILPRLTRYAYSVQQVAPQLEDEALDAMVDRLFDDIWSLTYVSLETQFGAYLNSMPLRILYNLRRKYVRADVSLIVERLDDAPDDALPSRHDTVADPRAELALGAVGEREALQVALAALPALERTVFLQRVDGVRNNDIARQLEISAATATRIYQRAVDELRRRLEVPEE